MLAFCAVLWYNFRQEGGQVVALCLDSRSGGVGRTSPRSAGFESYIVKARWPWLFSFACDFPEQIKDFFRWPALAGQFVPEFQNLACGHFVHLLSPAFCFFFAPVGAFDFFGKPRSGTGVPFSGASRDESVSAPLFGCSTSDRLANPNVQAGRNSQRRREKKFSYKPRIMPRNFSGL